MGDSDVNFPILGLHKPVAYCLAIEENGSDEVHEYVGESYWLEFKLYRWKDKQFYLDIVQNFRSIWLPEYYLNCLV